MNGSKSHASKTLVQTGVSALALSLGLILSANAAAQGQEQPSSEAGRTPTTDPSADPQGGAKATGTPLDASPQNGAVPGAATQSQAADGGVAGATASEDPTSEQDIVVTGLRASLESAQSIKRNSEQFVDSVTAQDIGRLPDQNISEALQRISGVQITRSFGEGNGISIRGLPLVRTELNGRDLFSANGGRSLSWEEIGVDLLSGVDVYKNPAAELIEGGLAGTVNIRTRLPFDQKGQLIAATASNTYYDLAKRAEPGFSGLYSNRWQTGIGEIGFLVNASWQRTAFRSDGVTVEPYWTHKPNPDAAAFEQAALPGHANETVLAPHGGRFSVDYGNRRRISVASALQWKPAENLEFYAQYLRADYKLFDSGVAFVANGDADLVADPNATFNVENGLAVTGAWLNPNTNALTYSQQRKTSTSDYSGGMKWGVTRRLHLTVDYQHVDSKADAYNSQLQLAALNASRNQLNYAPGYTADNYSLAFDLSGKLPSFLSTVPGYFADPTNYGLVSILPYAERNDATSDAVRADLAWDFDEGFIKKVSVGGRYTDKSAINRNTTYNTWQGIGNTCANWAGDNSCASYVRYPSIAEPNRYQSTLFRGDGAGTLFGPVYQVASQLTDNPSSAFAFLGTLGQTVAFQSFDSPNSITGTVNEKTKAAYGRVAFGAKTFADMRFDGNVGLRFVQTNSDGIGFQTLGYRAFGASPTVDANGNQVAPPTISERGVYSGGRDYSKWLPSANVRWYFTDRFLLRAAYSKNFYRPDFSQLNPSYGLSATYTGTASIPNLLNPALPYSATNPYLGTGSVSGNPNLKPIRATSYDAAFEWYFNSVGYVYLSLFKKNIFDLIDYRNTTVNQNISGIGLVQFNVRQLENINKSDVKGFEIGGQTFFNFLPAPFDGFGIQANYTFADSSAGSVTTGNGASSAVIGVPITGLSKHSFNLIGLYAKNGVNARVAYNWRSSFYQGLVENTPLNVPYFGDHVGYLDASITYDVNEHFALTLDGQNLLDTRQRFYQIDQERLRAIRSDDRRVSIRARIRY